MAPQTRKSKVKEAAAKTYHSSPVPQQVHFPARRTTVKTYGRRSGSARTLRQQTLTQIDYVKQVATEQDLLHDTTPSRPEPPKAARPEKRRKTMGDSPSSSFHTQTLTQFLKHEDDDQDKAKAGLMIKDSDDDDDDDDDDNAGDRVDGDEENDEDLDLPTSPPRRAPSKLQGLPAKAKRELVTIPHTPSRKKIKVNLDEVPSSQPSPFTPMVERYTPLGKARSPLKAKSTNTDAPAPGLVPSVSKRPRDLVIQDSYSSGSFPSSSPRKETPTPRPKQRQPLGELPLASFASHDLGEESSTATASMVAETPTRRAPAARSNLAFQEIPDSDDDLASLGPTPAKPLPPNPDRATGPAGGMAVSTDSTPSRASDAENVDPSLARIVARKSAEAAETSSLTDLSDHDLENLAPSTPTPIIRRQIIGADKTDTSISEQDVGEVEPGTPTPVARKRVQIALPVPDSDDEQEEQEQEQEEEEEEEEEVLKETPHKARVKSSPVPPRHTQAGRSQLLSQGLESQRLPMDEIKSMGPITTKSDILVSVHPKPAHLIATGMKDHEFRSYMFPEDVRCWIYVTAPAKEVRYMAVLGPAMRPGEIPDDSGVGNLEFNRGESGASFAYRIVQAYELNNPVPLAGMKDYGLGEGAPQKWRYVPPAVVGGLLGNLCRHLYAEEGEEGEEGGITVSQEVEEQLRSDIMQSTQKAVSDRLVGSARGKTPVAIPSSPELPSAARGKVAGRRIVAGPAPRDEEEEEEEEESVVQPPPPPPPAPKVNASATRFSRRVQTQRQSQIETQSQSQTQTRATSQSGVAAPATQRGRKRKSEEHQQQEQQQQQQLQGQKTPSSTATVRRASTRRTKTPVSATRRGQFAAVLAADGAGGGDDDVIRPSQATTASEPSSPPPPVGGGGGGGGDSAVEISPAKSSVPRPQMGDRSSSSLQSSVLLPDYFEHEEEEGGELGRSSPPAGAAARLRAARAGLLAGVGTGLSSLSSSSQAEALTDSLLVDEVRRPPEIFDSDDDDY